MLPYPQLLLLTPPALSVSDGISTQHCRCTGHLPAVHVHNRMASLCLAMCIMWITCIL